MATVLVRHKVADYAKWKSIYDSVDSFHKKNGVKSSQILKSADNPNELIILTEFETMEEARKFAQQEELKEIMQRGGVSDEPDVYFLEKAASRNFS